MRSSLFAGFFVVAACTQTAWADGLIYQLPADGVSVRYDTEVSFTDNNGQQREMKGSLTVSSVGQTTVDNEKCRWIEFKNVTKTDQGERIMVAKFLVPEKDLGKGKSPADHLVRGWVKMGDMEPQPISDLKGPRTRMLIAYLAGPSPNAKELDKVEIDGKLGKLSCAGVSGDQEFQRENGTLAIHFENRLNEKAPFGVVSAVWKFEQSNNGQSRSGTSKMTLAETNTTALSELPDRN
ncbi:MAG TPA: hypothetical protein VKU82_04755 [Planctomycetaceae bacterium]|nr:hypothetical protein [Planctomycetaceae bacterium]